MNETEMEAEIARLRAENERLRQITGYAEACETMQPEIDRLNAENAELKRMIETLNRITRRHATHPLT